MRILVVEDSIDVGDAVSAHLERLGHSVDRAATGTSAAPMVTAEHYDLLILDIMLPGLDGCELLRRVRARGLRTQVLMLTACAEIEERVRALDLGADDYLIKPFDFRELEARIRVLLRRVGGDSTNLLTFGNVTLDRKSRTAFLDNAPLDLTRREVSLLEIIIARPGRIFGKDELIEKLFNLDDSPNANTVEQHMARLRKKLAGANFEIRTLRGLGYQAALT